VRIREEINNETQLVKVGFFYEKSLEKTRL
jgi:hypothetical protein